MSSITTWTSNTTLNMKNGRSRWESYFGDFESRNTMIFEEPEFYSFWWCLLLLLLLFLLVRSYHRDRLTYWLSVGRKKEKTVQFLLWLWICWFFASSSWENVLPKILCVINWTNFLVNVQINLKVCDGSFFLWSIQSKNERKELPL